MTTDEQTYTWAQFLQMRGIRRMEDACFKCRGLGRRMYSDTSTWRHGTGGQSATMDVCGACWGSGDRHSPGADLRAIHAEARRSALAESAGGVFGHASGAWLSTMAPAARELVKEILALASPRRRRSRPEFWDNACLGLARVLNEAVDAAEARRTERLP